VTDTKNAIVLDDFGKLALQKYQDMVTAYNAEVAKLKSVESLDDFRADFEKSWPGVSELNEKIEKLQSALEDLLGKRTVAIEKVIDDEYKKAVEASGVDPTALDEQLKAVNATKRYLVSVYGDGVLEDTPKVEGRGRSGGSGSGTGGRRIRGFDVYVNGQLAGNKNKDGEIRSTFSAAAKVVGCETTELQRAFFEAAGNTDTNTESFPTVVEFDFKDAKIRAVKTDDSSEDDETDD